MAPPRQRPQTPAGHESEPSSRAHSFTNSSASTGEQLTSNQNQSDQIITEKACKKCRSRKLKCDRRWPRCARCTERGDECDFGRMIPAGAVSGLTSVNDDARIALLEAKITSLEEELAALHSKHSVNPADLPVAIHTAFIEGADHVEQLADFLTSISSSSTSSSGTGSAAGLAHQAIDWRLAQGELARVLSVHLIDSFFTSCCAYLPVFEPWHARLNHLRSNIDQLDLPSQVAAAGFCQMGARASPHSSLLGITYPASQEYPSTDQAIEAGHRRHKACLNLSRYSHDLCNRLEIAIEPTSHNLEALMVKVQMSIFEELEMKQSRRLLRLAIGMFKDLQDSPPRPGVNPNVLRLGLPIFLADALTSAYARKPPQITPSDLASYFRAVAPHVPDFTSDNLSVILDQYIPREPSQGYVAHDTLVSSTTILACWLANAQREFAGLATYRSNPSPLQPASIYRLWFVVDQIHAAVQRVQQLLVNIGYLPNGCQSDGCADLHLRFDTRLDRDLMDVTYLIHGFIVERLTSPQWLALGEVGDVMLVESDRRVRKAIKLVAFYAQLYQSSLDLHMNYHLVWQLELLPNWTNLAVQRWGEVPGPATDELEVTETELDWLVKGLGVAAFYHPVAERRLREIETWRRPVRNNS
ncbi:hypothetical protein T439DRAFT_323347 [Meredithblackwellia eburnea MCA 4105]